MSVALLAATGDVSRIFVELGAAIVGLAILARFVAPKGRPHP